MKAPIHVRLDSLGKEPFASILCYPKYDSCQLQKRLTAMELHGVTEIEFEGKANAFNVPVLGKGYVGIVVVAKRYGQRLALKIRRADADRADLFHEAEMLKKANSAGIGPEFVEVSKDFLLMQLIEGKLLPFWLQEERGVSEVRQVIEELMEQCWRLDLAGLDHGELTKAPKHVIVDECFKPWIVDFETASDRRKPANLTAICQYLVLSWGPVPKRVAEIVGERKRGEIIMTLRDYKTDASRENLDRVLQACLY